MPTPRLIIELTPSRVEVGVLRPGLGGSLRAVEWRHKRFGRAEWPTPYTTAISESQAAIAALLADMRITGGHATLIYSAPGAVSLVAPMPATLSTASSEQAARLALTGVADFPIDDAPADTICLHDDPAQKHRPAGSSEPVAPPQRHVLACADSDERADALCAMLESAGLTVDRILPADAVAIADVVHTAIASGKHSRVACVAWIGEHTTALAAVSSGRLLFVRTIAIGTEMLVDALRRPLRSRESDLPPVTLEHEAAREILLKVGVPAAETEIPGFPNLLGSSLLPHLQPVLQRLSVEIKQSLRFGMSDAERAEVHLSFRGPGSVVPNLPQSIVRLAGLSLPPDAIVDDSVDAFDSCTGGLIAAMARHSELTIALLPSGRRRTQSLHKIRRAVLIGAAFAAAFVTYETIDAHARLSHERRLLAAESAQARADAPRLAAREQATLASLALGGVEQRVRTTMGTGADWSAALAALSKQTPEAIRLNLLDMRNTETDAAISIRGHVRLDSTKDAPTLIREYITALQELPIVQGTTLGATNRSVIAGHDALTFELSLKLTPLPPRYLLRTAARPSVATAPAQEDR